MRGQRHCVRLLYSYVRIYIAQPFAVQYALIHYRYTIGLYEYNIQYSISQKQYRPTKYECSKEKLN